MALTLVKYGVDNYRRAGVPPSKLVLAFPFYGYVFNCADNETTYHHKPNQGCHMGGGVPWQNGGSGGSNHWPVTYDSRIDQASISTESANCSAKSSWRFGDAELGLGRHSRRACRRRGGCPRRTRSDFTKLSGEFSPILANSRQPWTEELSYFDQSIPSEGPLQACSIVGLSSHAMVHRNPPSPRTNRHHRASHS